MRAFLAFFAALGALCAAPLQAQQARAGERADFILIDKSERTLLVSGAIDLVMQSKAEGGRVVQTPDALAGLCYGRPAREARRSRNPLPVGASLVM